MHMRPKLATLILAMSVASALPGAAHAATDAANFIQTNGERIVSLAPQAANDQAVRAELLALVNNTLDVDGVARFALGPYLRQATPSQLHQYMTVFHQVISNGVTARLAAYAQAKFTMGREMPQGDATLVDTTISRPGNPPADVQWLVGPAHGGTRILDVIAEGTSLRQTERSDYTSYLQNHGGDVDQLIAALQKQVAQ